MFFLIRKKGLVISIDTYNEGYHFIDFKYPDLVIKKIIRSSISDLICKGVKPKYYFIAGSGNKRFFSKKNLSLMSKSLRDEQKKYGIFLCGGDTTYSNKLSFSITSIGYSKNIIYRNKAKLNDDIYVTGNLGDSYVGLQILRKKIKFDKKINDYFVKNYYEPNIQINFTKELIKLANSSIDISDGLIADLEKMINNQNLSYQINENKIPISRILTKIVKDHKFKKSQLISNGDDYQILFTASRSKARIIENKSKLLQVKITKIGKIISGLKKSLIIDQKGKQILIKNKGYTHQF
jgi:thiamine-monophosphate kinase